MVELTKKLMDILEDRKETLSGEDIKHIVESIQLSESMATKEAIDVSVQAQENYIKEQQEAMIKLGQEYMYGGQ